MVNTAGLESNSTIPGLSWKVVTKGRRSRKPNSRSLNRDVNLLNRSPKRVGDISFSDSDKFGEAITREEISDKVEYIPIKKRRHLLQLSSPSQVPSGYCEESPSPESLRTPTQSEELVGQTNSDSYLTQQSQSCDGLGTSKFRDDVRDEVMDVKSTEVSNGEYYNTGDFSGIALLAAAACSDGIDYNSGSVEGSSDIKATSSQQNFGASTSPVPLKPNLSVNNSMDSAEGDMLPDTKVECASALKKSPITSQDLSERAEDGELIKRSFSPKIDRLHWDLNTSMDSWEQPHDDTVGRNVLNNVICNEMHEEKLEIGNPEEHRDSDICLDNSEKCIPLTQMHPSVLPSVLKTEGNKEGPVSSLNATCGEEISASNLGHIEPMGLLSVERGIPCHDDEGAFLTDSTSDKCHNASTISISERKLTAASSSGSASIQGVGSDVSKCGYNEDLIKTCELTDDKAYVWKATGTVDSKMLDIGTSECTSSKCVDLPASKSTEEQCVSATGEADGKQDRVSTPITNVNDSHMRFEPKGPQSDDPAYPSMKVGIESSPEDGHNSDISQEDHVQPGGSVNVSGFHARSDSPFEDGELQRSVLYPWEENEVDFEMECVDYESDGDALYSDNDDDHSDSEVVEAGSAGSHGIETRNSPASIHQVEDINKSWSGKQSLRGESAKIDFDGKKGSDAGSGTTTIQHQADMRLEGNIGARNRWRATNHMNAYGFRRPFEEETGSSANKGKLHSHIEIPRHLNATDRKDAVLVQNCSPHGSYTKPKRDCSSGRYMGRYRSSHYTKDENVLCGNRGYWDSPDHYSSTYHGSERRAPLTRQRSFTAATGKFGGTDPHDYQHAINFPRRSSVDRDDFVEFPRGRLPVRRGIIPNHGGREGSRRYNQQIVRVFTEEGHNTLHDDALSFSPFPGRAGHISLPQKRSRSPHAWYPQRDRILRTRPNRSPDSRFEGRMERPRVPFQKYRHPVDRGEGFISPTSHRFSPHHHQDSRWVGNRNPVDDHMRHRRSNMGNIRRTNQRFDDAGSGELKLDDYFRPERRITSARFPPERGFKLEESYNFKRHDGRYEEMIQEARHCDARRHADDNYKAVEEFHCAPDQRTLPKTARKDVSS
ncbi:uncharacterized protein LOC116018704 [Ipomoea triloba]|uniref:uncharacterized protein LOC116018704 n=1 Tax=Ipomoea triloba TaxID=35885 RepID=UPI00125DF1FC|nr:uncharacterized protein LOC116018704 [Ipomoea triloba]XP_031114530.1 uncharacterized protein LOC116018704 [Ipomoea triloba]